MKRKNLHYYIFGLILSLLTLTPVLWAIITSFKTNFQIFHEPFSLPTSWDLTLYVETFKIANISNLFKNSTIITVITVFLSMNITYMSSFSIARLNYRYPGMSRFFNYLFLSATAVPPFITLMGIYFNTLAIGKVIPFLGIDTTLGLVFPYITSLIPFSTLIYVGGLKSLPVEIEEAAVIDGCKLFDVMYRIDLPLIKPVLATLFIFSALGIWNEFLLASIQLNSLKNYTVQLAMVFFKTEYGKDYSQMIRAVVICLIPQAIFFFLFQKKIIMGIVTSGLKG